MTTYQDGPVMLDFKDELSGHPSLVISEALELSFGVGRLRSRELRVLMRTEFH